jgi:hypothetical protein
VATKFCRDCEAHRPVSEFSKNARSPDGLAFYCRQHLAERAAWSREARRVQPRRHRFAPPDLTVPEGHKWCPDCGSVKALELFPRTTASRSRRATCCLPCHNLRGSPGRRWADRGPTTSRVGTASRPRSPMRCSRHREDPAQSVGQRLRPMWTTTMTRARSASCCAPTATGVSGTSRTILRYSVQPPTTSSDTGARGDPSAADRRPGKSPAPRPVRAGLASRTSGGAATGTPAGGRCRRAPDVEPPPRSAPVAQAARCASWPDSHPSGSPVGSPATARETPARGREADG